jgi:phage terminase large subunit-like protein
MWYDVKSSQYYVKNLVFYPKDMEEEKTRIERIPYAKWAKQGFCQAIGEEVVDFDEMADIILRICSEYDINIGSVAFDTKYSYTLIKRLLDELPMEIHPKKVEQDSRNLGDAISTLQRIVYNGTFNYAPNPLMESAFTNGLIEFRQGKPYIQKSSKERNKIDNLFSTFNAMKISMYFEQNNFYETEREFFFEL